MLWRYKVVYDSKISNCITPYAIEKQRVPTKYTGLRGSFRPHLQLQKITNIAWIMHFWLQEQAYIDWFVAFMPFRKWTPLDKKLIDEMLESGKVWNISTYQLSYNLSSSLLVGYIIDFALTWQYFAYTSTGIILNWRNFFHGDYSLLLTCNI